MPKPDYTPHLAESDSCRVSPDILHPTQFGVGMEEVRWRTAKLQRMDKDERHEYLVAREAPLVIGPQGRPYIVDRHHLARAMLDASTDNRLHGRIVAAWGDLDVATFWSRMQARSWVWQYDNTGHGPRPPVEIPDSLRALGDDYYRSLAWAIRERDAVDKVDVPFAEFHWALWLREVLPHPTGNFEADAAACAVLARESAAHDLPGWRG